MKKIFALVLATLMFVTLLTACATTPATTETTEPAAEATEATATTEAPAPDTTAAEPVTITVWAWDPNFNIAIMNEAASRYQATHPNVTVQVVEMAKADVEQKLHTVLAAQTGEGLPDIVLIEDYNAQKYLSSYPGQFADLTDEIDYTNFVPYKTQIMTLDGRVYGIPFDSGVAGMFYRTDILEAAGYTADDLNNITWDQFLDIAKVVKDTTGKTLFAADPADGGLMRIMLQSAGSWYFDKDGKPALTTNDALKEAMAIYKRAKDEQLFKPTSGWNEWVGAINSGDSASITTGVWIVGSVKAAADQSGKWAVATTPRLSTVDSVNASNLGGSSWYILENAPAKAAAIDFMKTIYCADVDFYQTILMNNGAVGSFIPAFEGEAFSTPDAFFNGAAIYADLSKWAAQIPAVDYGLYTYEADAAIMANMEGYYNGTMTVDEALEAAQAQLINSIG